MGIQSPLLKIYSRIWEFCKRILDLTGKFYTENYSLSYALDGYISTTSFSRVNVSFTNGHAYEKSGYAITDPAKKIFHLNITAITFPRLLSDLFL